MSPSDGAALPRRAMNARHEIAAAATRFAFSHTTRLDAELLMADAMGVTREALLLGKLDDAAPAAFAALADRRAAQEPIAYITGARAFWTIDLAVAPGVLVPRADSETLIEAAVDRFAGTPGPARILDLGTGSGALLLAALAEWPGATGVGIDASPVALTVAQGNAARLGMATRARFLRGDWDGDGGIHDLILCNPPYIEDAADLPREVAGYEPASALFAGADGLDEYRRIAPVLRRQLAAGGVACLEIGATQREVVSALFEAAGFAVSVRDDLGGHPRCLVLS